MATSATHTQQFALKWNNFHSNLSSGFHELFEAAEMVDVTLAVDGKFLQAHKVVLSICSPFFKEMFKVNPCKHPVVILKDVGHEHMKDILEFMYLGEVSVLRDNLTSFLRTAELLQVKGLTGDDSSESSSKEDEKLDCDNDEEEFSNLMQSMQYNRQYNSLDNHLPIHQHYSASSSIARNPTLTPPPVPMPQATPISNIPQPMNNKRYSRHSSGNSKRTKIDNNANQSLTSKSQLTAMPLVKSEEEPIGLIRKNSSLGPQEAEPEYTDLINMKSERSSVEDESIEKSYDKGDGFTDQGKPEAKYTVKPTYLCEICPKKFTRKDHLRTHEKNIHGEDAGPFVCIVCSQLYKNTESLRKHISKFHIAVQTESVVVNSARA